MAELSIEHLKSNGEEFMQDLKGLLKVAVDDSERAMIIKIFTEAMEDDLAFLEENEIYFNCLNKGIQLYEYIEPDSSDSEGEVEGPCLRQVGLYSQSNKHRQKRRRITRAQKAHHLFTLYKFAKGRKTCVAPWGISTPFDIWSSDKCFHSPCVAVHGIKSICMVTSQDMDTTLLPAFYHHMEHQNLRSFAQAVISDVECIPYVDYNYNDDELRLCCKGDIMKPFGVVSCPEGDPRYHELDRAIDTIQNCFPVLEKRPEDHFATIQAAIKAYQAMCQRELQAEDIWVSLMHVKYGCHEDLTIDIIREQLAIINGYSKEAPQKPLLFSCFSQRAPSKPAQKIGTSDNSNGGGQDGKGKHGRVRGQGSWGDDVGRVNQSGRLGRGRRQEYRGREFGGRGGGSSSSSSSSCVEKSSSSSGRGDRSKWWRQSEKGQQGL